MIISKLIILSLYASKVHGFSSVKFNKCFNSRYTTIQIQSSSHDAFNEYDEESNNYDIHEQNQDLINNDYTANFLQSLEEDEESTLNNKFLRDESEILQESEDRILFLGEKVEKCILVGVEDTSKKKYEKNYFALEESMNEMRELIKTAGMEIVTEVTQRLNEANPRTYIGSGKVKEVNDLCIKHKCETIVFDAEISPRQQKALENAFNKKALQNDFLGKDLEIKVVDRTALILDIFAQHAKTREGKLQVDLALHEYRKPRLTRMWTHLERQSGAGGVGLRGPGEKQIEMDQRIIRDRILTLQKKIDSVQKQRQLHRRKRKNNALPILSLVGYTNAGKSTLLNFLTRAGVMAENILFATLDPTTRRVKLPGYKTHPEVLLTDTVGFIQKLPTNLINAFRATLEEVQDADVIVHVIDVTHPAWRQQEASVEKVLNDIEVSKDVPIVRVFNKIDQLEVEEAEQLKYSVALEDTPTVAVSALTGDGMEDFVAVVEDALSEFLVPCHFEIPYDKGEELNQIHEIGNVDTIDYRATGTYVFCRIPKSLANRLKPYAVEPALNVNDQLKDDLYDDDIYMDDELDENDDWAILDHEHRTAINK